MQEEEVVPEPYVYQLEQQIVPARSKKSKKEAQIPEDIYQWDLARCQQQAKKEPGSSVAYYRMAELCFQKQDLDGAEQHLLKVAVLNADSPASSAIAAAAIIGESSRPVNGYNAPAAMGMPAAL